MFVFLVLALSPFATAQANYTTTASYGLADNNDNCATKNCFLQTAALSTGGNVSLTTLSTGFDLSVYGVGSDGNIYTLPTAASAKPTWSLTNMQVAGNYPATFLAVRVANGNLRPV